MIIHNDKPINHRFKVGDKVMVIPNKESAVTHEFVGKIVGFKGGPLIQVKDQDDDVFDCEIDEVRPAYEA